MCLLRCGAAWRFRVVLLSGSADGGVVALPVWIVLVDMVYRLNAHVKSKSKRACPVARTKLHGDARDRALFPFVTT